MRAWLLAAAVALGLFVVINALITPPSAAASLPRTVTLSSSNAEGGRLTQTIRDHAIIARLMAELQARQPVSQPALCPPNVAGQYVAVLLFPGGAQQRLVAEKAGCQRVSVSGGSGGTTWTDPLLLRDFDGLFPPSWQTGI